MNRLFKKGDKVIVGIHDEGPTVTSFRAGEVIFAGPYFVSVQTECVNPITGFVTAHSDRDTGEPYKITRSFSSEDVKCGTLMKINQDGSIPNGRPNPLDLNSVIAHSRAGISISDVNWYLANCSA